MPFKKGQVTNPKGRPKGAKNKSTLVRDEAEKRVAKALASGKQLTPLEFLLKCINNPALSLSARVQAATAALPYVHSRKPQEEVRRPNGGAGGLILVPADATLDDWTEEAKLHQSAIIEAEKAHAATH